MEKITANLISGKVSANSKEAFTLFDNQRFGEKIKEKISYTIYEAFYLVEAGKLEVTDSKNKKLNAQALLRKLEKIDKNFGINYAVFADLRKKGYIVKTALKFGAQFRVYEKGSQIGEEHAKWILFPVAENKSLTWQDFSAKNRVAHSTNKKLLIGIVDEEESISYYEVNWLNIK
jgi:tRNA-intron endonuclease